jgi:hypothetical protein
MDIVTTPPSDSSEIDAGMLQTGAPVAGKAGFADADVLVVVQLCRLCGLFSSA